MFAETFCVEGSIEGCCNDGLYDSCDLECSSVSLVAVVEPGLS